MSDKEKLIKNLMDSGVLKSQKVTDAFRKVKRHEFISNPRAYDDRPQDIGLGQTISAPHMVAIMTEELGVEGAKNILEIGTGSGYQAAILSECCPDARITTVERIPELMRRARKTLSLLRYLNVECVSGDGTMGYEPNSPYDRIMVTAASPEIPEPLIRQLGYSSRMVIPCGKRSYQRLMIVEKDDVGQIHVKEGTSCVFVPLMGRFGWK